MKKTLCLILISTLLFSISCNVSDGGDILSEPPVESKAEATEVQSPEESSSISEESLDPEESNSYIEETLRPEESTEASPDESSVKVEETESLSGIWWEYSTFDKYEEYLKFISNVKNPPDDFITYDMLKDIGEFRLFVGDETLMGYGYSLIGNNGGTIEVRIQPLPNKIKTYPIAIPDDSSDIRNVVFVEGWSKFACNNISYYYYNGELGRIGLTIGSCLVELFYSEHPNDPYSFAAYPLDGETTFVSQLLSLETAEAAVQSFNQKVEAEIAKNIADKQSKG